MAALDVHVIPSIHVDNHTDTAAANADENTKYPKTSDLNRGIEPRKII